MSSDDINPEPRKIRRANDAVTSSSVKPPAKLFDEFWREGEIALLFGTAGVGKSLLAVGVAEAVASGRPIEGFEMTRKPQTVLYVDLVLSDKQFAMRYSCDGRRKGRRRYKFSARFYRDRPTDGERLIDWLRAAVTEQKIRVVIIDDLSVISRCDDGTRETLELVRELRQMTREFGISVLVLADSQPSVFERSVAERDLRRARILCAYADSVFAFSAVGNTDRRHLVQTRAQAGDLVWTHRRPARFTILQRDDGFVGLAFEKLEMTDDERDLIIEIKEMHDEGDSFRTIADKLKMSKSTVARLHAKWTAEMQCKMQNAQCKMSVPPAVAGGCSTSEGDDWDETEISKDASVWLEHEGGNTSGSERVSYGNLTAMERADDENEWQPPKEAYRGEHTDDYLVSIGGRRVWQEKWEAENSGQLTGDSGQLEEECDQWDETQISEEASEWLEEEGNPTGAQASCLHERSENFLPTNHANERELFYDPSGIPFAAGLGRRSIHDLERGRDGYGREIYVESEHNGKPMVWYRIDKNGTTRRFTRGTFGVQVEHIDMAFTQDVV